MQGLNRWLALLFFLVLCFGVAAVASWMTRPEISGWYATIRKPSWTPPNWLFGPVWSALYAMMALAGWRVWLLEASPQRTLLLLVFALQLALNFAWSPVFFSFHWPGLAALVIAFLWLAIAAFTILSWTPVRISALLFLPYWAWVSFAAALNLAIWRLNALPAVKG
jgi:tryptophan-rich sensory protein